MAKALLADAAAQTRARNEMTKQAKGDKELRPQRGRSPEERPGQMPQQINVTTTASRSRQGYDRINGMQRIRGKGAEVMRSSGWNPIQPVS